MNKLKLKKIDSQQQGKSKKLSISMLSNKHLGFSLIELLIAMLVGLTVLSGVVRVFVDSKKNFVFEQEVAKIQENARFIIDEISNEVRMAEYYGCSRGAIMTNTIVGATTDPNNWMFNHQAIKGFEKSVTAMPTNLTSVKANTDVLVVKRADPQDVLLIEDHNRSLKRMTSVNNVTGYLKQGDIAVATSSTCSHTAVFQVSGVNNKNIFHAIYGGSPGTCARAFSQDVTGADGFDCSSAPGGGELGIDFLPSAQVGASIAKFKSTAYYVAESTLTGRSTLYRLTLVNNAGNVSAQPQELLTGVEDMQVIYGVDSTVSSMDGVVDQYFDAKDIVDDEGDASNSWVGWDRVISVRLNIILKSSSPIFSTAQNIDLGNGFEYNDTRFMYQKIVSTARIRNRALVF